MEIDARFPTIQTGQASDTRDGEPPPPALVGSGTASEFFISPVLRFDSRSLTVIFQVRDSQSGDVVRQFPPETVVERYRQDPTAKPFVLSPRSASGADHRTDTAGVEQPTRSPVAGAAAETPAPAGSAGQPAAPQPAQVDLEA